MKRKQKLDNEGPTPYVWEGKEESPVFPPKMVLIAEVLQNVINVYISTYESKLVNSSGRLLTSINLTFLPLCIVTNYEPKICRC